jgi:hypothetical protein
MKTVKRVVAALGVVAVVGLCRVNAQALFTVDELGNLNGQPVGQLKPDPSPSGFGLAQNVLVYNLPFAGLQGDVLMHDGTATNAPFLDVVRFDGNGHLIFYSDNTDGFDAPADTPSPPPQFFANRLDVVEVGNESFNYTDYVPTPNQPGWDPSNPTYRFISDIPEPGSAGLVLAGLAVLALRHARRKFAS